MEAPERIYLQASMTEEDDDWDDEIGVTWCVDRINDSDVEYVRRDVAAELYRALSWLSAQEGRKLTESEAFELGSYLSGLTWLAEDGES